MHDMKVSARAERTQLADLLHSLTTQQWQTPSLCEGWSIRDVVAHMLSYEELSPGGVVSRFTRGWWRFDRANAIGLDDYADHSPEELLDLLDRSLQPCSWRWPAAARSRTSWRVRVWRHCAIGWRLLVRDPTGERVADARALLDDAAVALRTGTRRLLR